MPKNLSVRPIKINKVDCNFIIYLSTWLTIFFSLFQVPGKSVSDECWREKWLNLIFCGGNRMKSEKHEKKIANKSAWM